MSFCNAAEASVTAPPRCATLYFNDGESRQGVLTVEVPPTIDDPVNQVMFHSAEYRYDEATVRMDSLSQLVETLSGPM